jgi:hypothetical protein
MTVQHDTRGFVFDVFPLMLVLWVPLDWCRVDTSVSLQLLRRSRVWCADGMGSFLDLFGWMSLKIAVTIYCTVYIALA